jgi:hypothetical protein
MPLSDLPKRTLTVSFGPGASMDGEIVLKHKGCPSKRTKGEPFLGRAKNSSTWPMARRRPTGHARFAIEDL